MPFELPDPRNTTGLPTADEPFPYNKLACSGETPSVLPTGSATPFTNMAYPQLYVPWNHLTAGFPEDLRKAIANSPDKFMAGLPYGAGPKWYADNPRADLLLKEFLDGFDFPDKGPITVFYPVKEKVGKKGKIIEEGRKRKSAFDKPWPLVVTGISEDFMKYLIWQQTFAIPSCIVWNFVLFDPKALAWVVAAFQGNIVRNDATLIAEALACLKVEAWRSVPLQNLVKRITQAKGKSGNPIKLTVKMTQSWRLTYVETKNLEDDKGPVFLLMGEPIMDDLDLHRALTTHIRNLRVRVNYQQLLNVDKIIGCDWCKNQNHPSHACPFPGVDSAWYGPTADELRLCMMKAGPPNDPGRKRKEGSSKPGGRSKQGKNKDDEWSVVRRGKKH
ncbi:uncharacterized protein EV420DRAFT_1068677 [Desarmillaria tabescens]|uniref:Uncharacterized protein n=1 Tax=Armillaria tabescens TaxID=1929756 RepID=A0AA39MR00_ARMTA|nr:uncharacterized protein EV420DRAFT_1068677 [Desarmillaria tabescens]KAK0443028.1 hypothetical protein EV420DRAFT_1068677 [Desarmillaria tabescens]